MIDHAWLIKEKVRVVKLLDDKFHKDYKALHRLWIEQIKIIDRIMKQRRMDEILQAEQESRG